MGVKKVSVQQVVRYGGHSVNRAGVVQVTFVADGSELVGTIQTLQTLGEDVTVKAKPSGKKAMLLGTFKVKSVTTNGDGISKIKFESLRDHVEIGNIDSLPLMQDELPVFKVLYEAQVEVEEDA